MYVRTFFDKRDIRPRRSLELVWLSGEMGAELELQIEGKKEAPRGKQSYYSYFSHENVKKCFEFYPLRNLGNVFQAFPYAVITILNNDFHCI